LLIIASLATSENWKKNKNKKIDKKNTYAEYIGHPGGRNFLKSLTL
jgi:hypothetical protein